jgi:Putative Ig domain
MRYKILGAVVLFVGLAQSSFGISFYDPCLGFTGLTACTFDGTGRITLVGSNIIFHSDANATPLNFFTASGGTGVFANFPNGSQETIQSLGFEPVGTVFAPIPFFGFPVGGQPPLDVTFIQAGQFSTLTCGGAAAAGQTCTPALLTLSSPGPFNFSNFNDPNFGLSSTVSFTFSGVSADGAAKWSTIFTSQFLGQPFQTVLAQLNNGTGVSKAYSQATVVMSSTVSTGITITTTSVANGVVGTAYSQNLTAIGGTLPYSWSVIAGRLPAGLTLDRTGQISGTPVFPGTSVVTFQVSDSGSPSQIATVTLIFTIN